MIAILVFLERNAQPVGRLDFNNLARFVEAIQSWQQKLGLGNRVLDSGAAWFFSAFQRRLAGLGHFQTERTQTRAGAHFDIFADP